MTTLEAALQSDPDSVNLFSAGVKIGEVGAIQLQAHIRVHPRLCLLELKGSVLGRRGCEHLCQALRNHPGLRHLGLGRCHLDGHAAVSVMKTLLTTQVQTLDLEWNGLGDPVAEAVADYLRASTTILSLSLERNDIRSDGAAAIADALCVNTSLRNLNLAFNKIGVQACDAFRRVLITNTTLLTLNLNMNAIYHDGAALIAEGLCKNRNLLSLNLQSNQAVESFAHRGDAMDYGPVLKELNFSLNRFPGPSAEGFSKGIRTAKGLIALSLAKCHIGEPHISAVLDAVASLGRLQTLDLGNTLMTVESAESLSIMLTRCANISQVVLDENRFGRIGAESIGEAIRSCSCLTSLSMNNCELGPLGAASIANGIKGKRGLPMRELRLRANGVQNYGCLAICAALTYTLGEGEGALEDLDLADDNLITGESCQFLGRVLYCNSRLQSVTIRNNQIAEDVQASYLDLERALAFTGGVIGDPEKEQLALAAHETKATFSINRDADPARTNFNSSTDTYHNTLLINKSRLSATGPALLLGVAQGTQHVPLERAVEVYSPGQTPMVPVLKRRHELHRVEENVSLLPISETQLRQKFSELDRNNDGFLGVEEFSRVYSSFQLVSVDDTNTLQPLVHKYAKNGRIYFDAFAVLMLKLVGM